MNRVSGDVVPDVVQRRCGGWLAVAPKGLSIRLGVTAETEARAREKFSESLRQMVEELEADARR
jgi:hypothetical protein